MQMFYDLLPVLLFFAAYKLYGLYAATAVAMLASAAQVGWGWWRHGRVERMHLVTLALIVVLGGATLLLQDERFIKWKPTAVNWLFAVAFFASQFIGRKPLVRRMMESRLCLPDSVWGRLNLSWVAFFAALGAANLVVAFRFDTETWVNFKLFGLFGLTLVFVLGQALYLARHMPEEAGGS